MSPTAPKRKFQKIPLTSRKNMRLQVGKTLSLCLTDQHLAKEWENVSFSLI